MQRQEAGLKYHPCLVSNPDPKQPTMKLPYPATILLVLITTVSYAITRVSPKKNFIDVEKYSICITINESDSSIRCTTLIRFKSYKNSRKIWFNFRGLDLDSCLFEGKPVSYSRNKGQILLSLPRPARQNVEYEVAITYHGRPSDGLIIGHNQYGHFSAFSDNWAERAEYWFPCDDRPYDKARVDFQISVPGQYQVIANGNLKNVSHGPGGRLIYQYLEEIPIPVYCMVIGVARFAVTRTTMASGLPVYYYTFPEDSLTGVSGFARVPDIIHFYDSLVGPYPYSSLSLVESSTRYGGMENSTAIFFPEKSPSYTGKSNNDETVAHEIAHQWFGDQVTEKEWSDLWLSEGFATYFSALYFESRCGKEALVKMLGQMKEEYIKYTKGNIPVVYKKYKDPVELLSVENYQKGALFLHALRLAVGDKAWFRGIREFYSKYSRGNTTTADFMEVMEQDSGIDLHRLFHQWLYRPGLPD